MKGKIRLDPKAADHVIREGLIASGMMTRKVAQRCKISVSRVQNSGEKMGILLAFNGQK